MVENLINLDNQFPELPKQVKFCKRCVVSNQKPRLRFDENGVCAACEWARIKDNDIDWSKRQIELENLCEKHRSKDGGYDVIVPGSGGKDSAFVAGFLKNVMGMNPLCITWAPFDYTSIGWKNLNSFVGAGYDNILAMPKGNLHRKLCRVSFELVGDPFLPFIFGQKAYAYHLAKLHDIRLIFYGENGEVEYGGSEKYRYLPNEQPSEWKEQYFKGAEVDRIFNAGVSAGVIADNEFSENELWWYKAPDPEKIEKLGLEMHWMSYYRKWVPQENYYYAALKNNFIPNLEGRSESTYTRMSSLDDKVDGFHYYLSFIKFGIGRATRDAMTDIYRGHISRAEGVELVKKYDADFPIMFYENFKKYTGVNDEKFTEVINKYRQLSNVWDKSSGEWKLRYTVFDH